MAACSADLLGRLPRASAHLDELADAVLERFAAGGGPEGAPDAATLRNLRVGARAAAVCFLARLAASAAPADVDLFVAHGRAQQAAGRTLTELLSFYRLGGLAMWERSTALLPDDGRGPGAGAGAAPPSASEIFDYGRAVLELVDELSVAAAEGSRRRRPRRGAATAPCASGWSRCC